MATTQQKRKTGRVMHEYKHGELKSGSGRKVKSRKQAIAIAMSESGQSRRKKSSSSSSKKKSTGSSRTKSSTSARRRSSRSTSRKKS